MSKKEVFWDTINCYKPDFLIGCETWSNSTIMDNEVLLIGYKIHRKDHIDGYGGVLIAIKNNFTYEPLAITADCEICAVSVKFTPGGVDPLILIIVYRPANRYICYH